MCLICNCNNYDKLRSLHNPQGYGNAKYLNLNVYNSFLNQNATIQIKALFLNLVKGYFN